MADIMNPYEEYKIYGPYLRKDGRKHVCGVHRVTRKKITVSYPKYLMELKLGRKLNSNETVDHIDRDFTNNDLDNLQVLIRKLHAKIDATYLDEEKFICPVCNKDFIVEGKLLKDIYNNRKKKNSTGPYCSRKCAGKGSNVRSLLRGRTYSKIFKR